MSSARLEAEHARLLPAMLVPPSDGSDPDSGPLRRSRRDWIVDMAFFAVALLGGLLTFSSVAKVGEPSDPLVFADVAGGLLAALLLWFRRRWPVGVAVAVIALASFSAFAGVASILAIFTVAVHRRFGVVAAVAALGLATLPLYLTLHPDKNNPAWLEPVFAVLLTGGVVAWGMFVRARRQLVASLWERAHRAEAEQQLRVEQGRQQERARIAREMHDVLAHRISLLSMHAGALEFRPDAPPEEIARAAGIVRASAHQALQDLREVIGVLREEPADGAPERPQPTLVDLPGLLDESREAGMHVSSEYRLEDLATVPAGVGRNAYRIVQEGLTNARKHAHGAAVDVIVDGVAGSGLTVEVRNRLALTDAGAAQIPGAGTGLIGLYERTSLAGGRLEHGRTPGGDFQLRAWLPWPS
jgi:signal transduction histidine kinase